MTQPKETPEEASIRFNPTKTRSSAFGNKYIWIPHKERQQFINGAKWQEEHFNSLIEEKDKEILRLKEDLEHYIDLATSYADIVNKLNK